SRRRVGRATFRPPSPSFLPEELPRVPLQIAHQLLQIVVDLRIDQQRSRRALALLDVADQRLRVRRQLLRLVADDDELVERLLQLVALAGPDDAGDAVDAVERLLRLCEKWINVALDRLRDRLDVADGRFELRGVADAVLDRRQQPGRLLRQRVDVAEEAPDLGLVGLEDVVERAHHRRARLQEVLDDVFVVAEQARDRIEELVEPRDDQVGARRVDALDRVRRIERRLVPRAGLDLEVLLAKHALRVDEELGVLADRLLHAILDERDHAHLYALAGVGIDLAAEVAHLFDLAHLDARDLHRRARLQ